MALFLATGNRKALHFSLRLLKWSVAAALIVFALIILERVTSLN